jgi:type II secretory pathway component GspD/PulD (secretin)
MLRAPRITTRNWLFAAALAAGPAVRAQDQVQIPVPTQTPASQPPVDSKPASTPVETKPAVQPPATGSTTVKPEAATQDSSQRGERGRRFDRGERTGSQKPASEQILGGGAGRAEKLQLNVTDLEWERLLEILAARTGRTLNFVGKKPPSDKPVTYKDDQERPIGDVIDILNLMLIPKGHIIQRQYNFLHVIEFTNNQIPPQYIDYIALMELPKKGKTEIVRVLYSPKSLVASSLATEFKDFLAPVGTLTALASTNQLVVTGTADAVRQTIALIAASDGPTSDPPNYRAFPLKFVPAVEAEYIVRGVLGMPARDAKAAPVPGQNPGQQFDRGGRGNRMAMMFGMQPQPQPGQPQPGQQPTPGVDPTKGPFVVSEERTNTLYVFATPDKIAIAEKAIKDLDQPQAAEGQSNTPRFEVYEVESGTAQGIATAIGSVFEKSSDTRVEPHPDGNHLLVHATPREHGKVKEIIAKLKSESKRFEGVQLRELDAILVATSIRKLLGQKEDDGNQRMRRFFFFGGDDESKKAPGPQVAADASNNRLLIYGTEPQIQLVKELLIQLGETSLAAGSDRGRTRVIQFGDADPREFERRLKETWSRLGNSSPIRVEVLGGGTPPSPPATNGDAPKRGERPPVKLEDPPTKDRKSSATMKPDASVRYASLEEPAKPKEQPPANNAGPQPLPQPPGAPPTELPGSKGVTIIVGPNTVIVQSDDPKALDEAEKMVRMLAQPPRGTYVAMYQLKSADSYDMATMLDDIINPPRSSGFGFFGSEETEEEKAQRARIASDSRMNALIVTGPQAAHQKVKELLKILDIESPDTDVKSAPRAIEIKYKSAEAVAEQLRQQFAPEVFQAPQTNQQQQQQGGPGGGFGRFGFFGGGFGGGGMGGGGSRRGGRNGGSGNQGESRGKIVITADDVSNTVWVTAAKPKFDEIETVAKQLDSSAANAKQTVRVLTLKHTNTETMRKMLHQMYGVESTEAQPTGPGGGRTGQGMGSGFQGGRGPGGFQGGGDGGGRGDNSGGGDDGGGRRSRRNRG